jgi:hypothetical protein
MTERILRFQAPADATHEGNAHDRKSMGFFKPRPDKHADSNHIYESLLCVTDRN